MAPKKKKGEKTAAIFVVSATSRNVLIGPTKLALVLDKIRGKTYKETLEIFKNLPQRAGRIVWKTLYSAISNATNNYGLEKSELVIFEAFANQGRILKRRQPRAKGRSYEIQRKISHVTIRVARGEDVIKLSNKESL